MKADLYHWWFVVSVVLRWLPTGIKSRLFPIPYPLSYVPPHLVGIETILTQRLTKQINPLALHDIGKKVAK